MKITFEFDTCDENFDMEELARFNKALDMAKALYEISNKAFYTRKIRFVWGKATPVEISAEFTLSQCRIGWCKLWNNIQIHLLFVDIIIDYLRLNTREHARQYIQDSKNLNKRI